MFATRTQVVSGSFVYTGLDDRRRCPACSQRDEDSGCDEADRLLGFPVGRQLGREGNKPERRGFEDHSKHVPLCGEL